MLEMINFGQTKKINLKVSEYNFCIVAVDFVISDYKHWEEQNVNNMV